MIKKLWDWLLGVNAIEEQVQETCECCGKKPEERWEERWQAPANEEVAAPVPQAQNQEPTYAKQGEWVNYKQEPGLEIYYCHQLVSNESAKSHLDTESFRKGFKLEYTPILVGTVTGTIFMEGKQTQTFVQRLSGEFEFQDVDGVPAFPATGGELHPATGELYFQFGDALPNHDIVISYEYNHDS